MSCSPQWMTPTQTTCPFGTTIMWGDITVKYVFVPGYPGLSAGAVIVFVAYSLVPFFIPVYAVMQFVYAGTIYCEWRVVEKLDTPFRRAAISFLLSLLLILLAVKYFAYDITRACVVAAMCASLVFSAVALIGPSPQRPTKIEPFFWCRPVQIFRKGELECKRPQCSDKENAWRIREMFHSIKLLGICVMSAAAKWFVYVVFVPLYALDPNARWLFLSPQRPPQSCSTLCAMPSGRVVMATSVFIVLLIENCMRLQGANLKKQDDVEEEEEIERNKDKFRYTETELQKMGIVPITISQFLHRLASLCAVFLPVPVSVLQLADGSPEQVFVGFCTGILVALMYQRLWTAMVLGYWRRPEPSQSMPSEVEPEGFGVDKLRKVMVEFAARPLGFFIRYSVIVVCVLKGTFTIGMAAYGLWTDIQKGVFSTGGWRRIASISLLAVLYAANGLYVRMSLSKLEGSRESYEKWKENVHFLGWWTILVLAACSPGVLSIISLQLEPVGPFALGFTRAPLEKASTLTSICISGAGKLMRYFVLERAVQEKAHTTLETGLRGVHARNGVQRQLSDTQNSEFSFALILTLLVSSVSLVQFSWDLVLALLNFFNANDVKMPDLPATAVVSNIPGASSLEEAKEWAAEQFTSKDVPQPIDMYLKGDSYDGKIWVKCSSTSHRDKVIESINSILESPGEFGPNPWSGIDPEENVTDVLEFPPSWPAEPVSQPSQRANANGVTLGFEFWNAGSEEENKRLRGELKTLREEKNQKIQQLEEAEREKKQKIQKLKEAEQRMRQVFVKAKDLQNVFVQGRGNLWLTVREKFNLFDDVDKDKRNEVMTQFMDLVSEISAAEDRETQRTADTSSHHVAGSSSLARPGGPLLPAVHRVNY